MIKPRLTPADIVAVARIVNCDEATIKAVIDVEAGGSGFDDKGRPTVLFEPHIFERELNAAGIPDNSPVIQEARRRGICSPEWNKALYGKSADARWDQIAEAIKINQELALKSASYGIGQVLGQNHKMCGYATATAMLNAMCKGEADQLAAMITFIQKRGLADELERRDWAGFARGYNGPSYHLNNYDTKLRRAYEKHRADPNVFWTGARARVAANIAHIGS